MTQGDKPNHQEYMQLLRVTNKKKYREIRLCLDAWGYLNTRKRITSIKEECLEEAFPDKSTFMKSLFPLKEI